MLNHLTIDLLPRLSTNKTNNINSFLNSTLFNLSNNNIIQNLPQEHFKYFQTNLNNLSHQNSVNLLSLQNQQNLNNFVVKNNKKIKKLKKYYFYQQEPQNILKNLTTDNNIINGHYYMLDHVPTLTTPTLVALGFACQNNVDDFGKYAPNNFLTNYIQNKKKIKERQFFALSGICGIENAHCLDKICQCRPNYIQAGSSLCIAQEKS